MDFKVSAHDFVTEKHCSLNDNYEIKEALGEGSYGSVRKVTHKRTREDRAVKILHKRKLQNPENIQELLDELYILRDLDHPNILKVYESYQDKYCYCLVTELCSGGELFDKIQSKKQFPEDVAAYYIRQILSCLYYCHEKHIMHRDLKPENFLFDYNSPTANLKLIDFGSATHFGPNEYFDQMIGTVYYIAPEVVQKHYNEKCDIWSAGTILYIMLCGTYPFSGQNDSEILENVRKGKYSLKGKVWDRISPEAKDLVRKLMNVDFRTRITARETLNHPWFTNAFEQQLDRSLSAQILDDLQSFHSEKKLQKATLSLIASQFTTKDEREQLRALFKKLDRDNNGTLSKHDILNGVGQFRNISETEAERILREVDSDQSGEIDFSEFVTASFDKKKLLSSERLNLAFGEYDVDRCGKITKEKIRALLGKDHEYDDSVWESMIQEADVDGDGVIDLQEFCSMMLSLVNI
jgi:calcium-dependent protein kinase